MPEVREPMTEPEPEWITALPEGFSLCRICGRLITGFRRRPGHRPEAVEGAFLHACPPRKWRNYWHRQGRRERRERVTGSSHQTQAGGILYIVGLGHQGRRQPPC